eukprot:403336735
MFGQGGDPAQTQNQKEKGKSGQYSPNDLTKILKMEDFEAILSITVDEVQFCQIKPRHQGGQIKETIFMNGNLSLKTEEILIEGVKHTLIVMCITNEDYDANQEQEPLKRLPITQDMQLISYTGFTEDGEDTVQGYAFLYLDQRLVYSIECIFDGKDKEKERDQKEQFDQFKTTICQILLALNEGKNYTQVAKRDYMKYQCETTLDFMIKQNDLVGAFGSTTADQAVRQKKNVRQQIATKKPPVKKYNQNEIDELIKKMSSLDVMKDEIKKLDEEVKLQITQRMIQIEGDLLEYSPFIDENITRAKDIFLCIDQVTSQGSDSKSKGKFEYMINIIDKTGKISYTRKAITASANSDIQLSSRDMQLNFIGNPRKGSKFIPGYVFKIYREQDLANLRGVLTKCFFEVQNQQQYEKAVEKEDNSYLEQQLESNYARGGVPDVEMKEIEEDMVDEYDFDMGIYPSDPRLTQQDYNVGGQQQNKQGKMQPVHLHQEDEDDFHRLLSLIDQSQISYKSDYDDDKGGNDDEYRGYSSGEERKQGARYSNNDDEEEKQPSHKRSGKQQQVIEDDDDYGDEEGDKMYGVNKELVQAQTYDRTFILNGPIVKVYQNAEESGFGNEYEHQRLQHTLDLPALKDQNGNQIVPQNLILANNESNLIFNNEKENSQLFMFDLETGKIVQQLKTGKDVINFQKLSNETKNGQREKINTFMGLDPQGIYRLDPRESGNNVVDAKTYKTNVNFSSISTTMGGAFALGSVDGAVRLYKQLGQNAKTLLPGLGERIQSIDISQDEQWILASCQTYLLVIPTTISDGSSGFAKSMGKEKPAPLKLSLKPQDIIKYQIKQINFTPARFNNGDNIVEDSIVTSCGDLLITWNFNKVKRGVLRSYKIKKLPQPAVDGQFQFNNEEKVLVTLPKMVEIETRHKVRKQQ